MSEPRYEIIPDVDGTFTVSILDEAGGVVTTGLTRQQAEDFVQEQQRKAGHDPRWPEIDPDSR